MIDENTSIPSYLVVVITEPLNTLLISYDKQDLASLLASNKGKKISIYKIGKKNILDQQLEGELNSILVELSK